MSQKYIILIIISLFFGSPVVHSQKLEKGFKALSAKDFFKSKRIFEKSMYGYPTTSSYGLSLMYYEQQNPFFSLDSALKYIVYSDSALTMADKKEIKMVNHFAISKEVIAKHRLKIATKAYELLKLESNIDKCESYLKKYPFSDEYVQVVKLRDSTAFSAAKLENNYNSYRNFIINYPGSEYRNEADSLYAKSFFKSKVGEGGVSVYKQFVKDFPASPYIEDAYDQIFTNVRALDTKEAYTEFIDDYPENMYTELAWKNLIGLILKEDYSEKALAKILADYPINPLNEEVESELKGYFISYFPVLVDEDWGFIRGDGEVTIEPQFEYAGEFEEGLAIVSKRGKSGFINKKGEIVVTIEYDEVTNFKEGTSIVEKGERYGAIDRRNKVVIPIEFDDVGRLVNDRILVEKGGKIGYFNGEGKLVIDFIYENGVDFKNGVAVVKSNGMYGMIDVDNNVVLPFEYDWIESSEEERIRVKQGSSFGLVSRSGESLLPLEYDWISPAEKEKPILLEKNLKIGYLNSNNEISIPLKFDIKKEGANGSLFQGDFARVRLGNKYGVIDANGVEVLAIDYDTLGLPSENFVAFKTKSRWGFRELNEGRRIIEPRFDQVLPFERGISVVRIGDKYGVIDPNGFSILKEEYSSILSEQTVGLLIVEKNGLKGLMDRDKNLILGFKYNDIEIKNYRYAKTTDSNGVQFYDLQKNKFIYPKKK